MFANFFKIFAALFPLAYEFHVYHAKKENLKQILHQRTQDSFHDCRLYSTYEYYVCNEIKCRHFIRKMKFSAANPCKKKFVKKHIFSIEKTKILLASVSRRTSFHPKLQKRKSHPTVMLTLCPKCYLSITTCATVHNLSAF